MPDPNNPTQGPIPEEEAEVIKADLRGDESSKDFVCDHGAEKTPDEKSSIQGAMEDALDRSLTAAAATGDGSIPLKTYPITEKMRARLTNEFTYHAPREDQIPRYNALRSMALTFATMIVELTPPGREQALALTKLGESIMYANAAIAWDEEVSSADTDFAELLHPSPSS